MFGVIGFSIRDPGRSTRAKALGFVAVLQIALIQAVPVLPAAAQSFELEALPELLGGTSRAAAVLDRPAGLTIVGESRMANGSLRAVRWEKVGGDWQVSPFPVLDPGQDSRATGLFKNEGDLGVAIGATKNTNGLLKPAIWRETRAGFWDVFILATFGGQTGEPLAGLYKNDGDLGLVGWSSTPAGVRKAAIWIEDKWGDLDVEPLPDFGPGLESRANDLFRNDGDLGLFRNDGDLGIVGGSVDETGYLRPTVWIRQVETTEIVEPPLSGYVQGEVLGTFRNNGDLGFYDDGDLGLFGWVQDAAGDKRAVVWRFDGADWFLLELSILSGAPELVNSVAVSGSFRNDGDLCAVGIYYGTFVGNPGNAAAALWMGNPDSPTAFDLNTLVANPNEFLLEIASDIAETDSGLRIVGSGRADDGSGPHGYVVIERQGTTAVEPPVESADRPTLLRGAFPNPARTQTAISFTLNQDGPVALSVLDIQGRVVADLIDEYRPAGEYETKWNARNGRGTRVVPGVYFLRLATREGLQAAKVVIKG